MREIKLNKLLMAIGVISIATGLVYLLGFYGPTEGEVKEWAMLSVLGGIASLVFADTNFKKITLQVAALIGYGLILIAQILPMFMWFTAPMLTDKRSDFIMSTWYSLPHFVLGILALIAVIRIWQSR